MNHQEFLSKTDVIHAKCKALLDKKKRHRETDEDRLYQFKQVAELRQTSEVSAVADMMVKHTTQLFAMVKNHEDGEEITLKEWRATLYDDINYRYLMLCVLDELLE